MKKTKKTLLTLGSLGAVAAPIAGVISCGMGGYEGRFDQANDNTIKIMYIWTKGGKQERALIKQINAYNATNPTVKVEKIRFAGGYDAISPSLVTKFEAGDTKTLPNLIFGYGDTLGSIVKYDMELNMEMAGTGSALRNKFEDKFMIENDVVGGLDGSKGTYIVPAAKSTDVESINKPLLGYLFAVAEEHGATIGSSITTDYPAPTGEKLAWLESLWGNKLNETGVNVKQDMVGTIIDGKFFTDYKEQLEVATKIQGIMKNGGKTGELHVLGYDNVVNSAYMIAYAKLGAGDLTQSGSFLFNKGTNGFVKHNFLKSSGKEKEAFDYAYGLLKPAINNGALYLNVGGAYTSRLGVKDQIGLSIGSTAGYSHNYKKAVKQYSFDGHKITGKAEAVSVPKKYTGENYAGEFGHYQTPIAKTQQAAGKYGIVADQDKFKNVKDAIVSGIAYSISSDSSQRNAQGVIQINSKYCLLPTKDKVTFKLLSTTHQLVKGDLQIKLHPYLAGGNTNKFTFSQGPSIIGVHANLKEDKGTREFMKWLTTKDTTSKISPLDTFAKDASYIAPTKGSFGKEVNRNTYGYNDATATAFNAFKEIVDGTGNIFTNPIDDTTSALRKAVGGAMNKSFVQVQSRDRALSISSVYGLIRADFDL